MCSQKLLGSYQVHLGARRSQESQERARRSQEEPGGARSQESHEERQMEPNGATRSQEEPGGTRRSEEKPGGARRSQEEQALKPTGPLLVLAPPGPGWLPWPLLSQLAI